MKKRLFSIFGLGLAVTLSSALASPVPLGPGDNASPAILTVGSGSTLLASVSGSFTSGTFNANYLEDVYSDPSNVFCAGCLDWVIQIQDTGAVGNSAGIIEHVTASDFTGYQAIVGVDSGSLPTTTLGAGTMSPSDVERSGDGSTITWDYTGTGGTDNIQVGETTVLLEAMTNAPTYVPGHLGAIDGSGAGADAYAPAPEPVSMSLLGGGLMFLGLARWRRSARKA